MSMTRKALFVAALVLDRRWSWRSGCRSWRAVTIPRSRWRRFRSTGSGSIPPPPRPIRPTCPIRPTWRCRDWTRSTGFLKRDTDDAAEFTVGTVELDFGPEAWVLTAAATEDFDDDGRTEKLLAELNGLVGQPVRLAGRIELDGEEADVYLLNDLTYRDPVSDQVPWRPTPAPGEPASRRTVTAAAVAAVGPGFRVDELERERVGSVEWSASVLDADGRE